MNITIEELYKIKQENKNVDEYFLSKRQEENRSYITERINSIEFSPEIINTDTENYFMNLFCTENEIGSKYNLIKKWYETALHLVLFKQKDYDITELICEYENLYEELKSEEYASDIQNTIISLFFEEFSVTNNTEKIESYYLENRNFGEDSKFNCTDFYYLLQKYHFFTQLCNPRQVLIDMWNRTQDLYCLRNTLNISIEDLKDELDQVKDKLIFKSEECRNNYESAYDEDLDDY